MNLLAKLISMVLFNIHSDKLGRLISFITLKRCSSVKVYNFERRFNRKVEELMQQVCKHPSTYDSHDWGGGFRCCTFCHKTLSVLWRPESIKSAGR